MGSAIRLAEDGHPRRRWVLLGSAICIPIVGILILLPRVTAVSPTDGDPAVSIAESVVIEFNWPMDRKSVENSLQTTPATPGTYEWQGTQLSFTPASVWPEQEAIRIEIREGARSALGLPLLQNLTLQFETSQARVLYAWPQSGDAQLYRTTLAGGETIQLSNVEGGLLDYDASPVRPVAYLATAPGPEGNEILQLAIESHDAETLRDCQAGQVCSQISLSPDSTRLAFSVGSAAADEPDWTGFVVVVDLMQSPGKELWRSELGVSSPDWVTTDLLAASNQAEGAHLLMDLSTPQEPIERALIEDELRQPGTWSPDGRFWVGSQVDFLTSRSGTLSEFFSHLVRVDASSGSQVDLTGQRVGLVEDGTPAYSPDGSMLVYGRKYLDADRWTLGRQLWVMRADGSQARAITDFPIYHHSGFVWSPDGSRLLVQRFDQADPTTPGDVGWVELRSGRWTMLAEGAFLPHWTP